MHWSASASACPTFWLAHTHPHRHRNPYTETHTHTPSCTCRPRRENVGEQKWEHYSLITVFKAMWELISSIRKYTTFPFLKHTQTHTHTVPLSVLPISRSIKLSTTGERTIKYSVIANELYCSDMQINAHTLTCTHIHTCGWNTHTHIYTHNSMHAQNTPSICS